MANLTWGLLVWISCFLLSHWPKFDGFSHQDLLFRDFLLLNVPQHRAGFPRWGRPQRRASPRQISGSWREGDRRALPWGPRWLQISLVLHLLQSHHLPVAVEGGDPSVTRPLRVWETEAYFDLVSLPEGVELGLPGFLLSHFYQKPLVDTKSPLAPCPACLCPPFSSPFPFKNQGFFNGSPYTVTLSMETPVFLLPT